MSDEKITVSEWMKEEGFEPLTPEQQAAIEGLADDEMMIHADGECWGPVPLKLWASRFGDERHKREFGIE